MVRTAAAVIASLALASVVKADAWMDKYGGFPDPAFAGVATFAHLEHQRCLDNPELPLDLAIIGIPYDSAVTFRPGMSRPVWIEFVLSHASQVRDLDLTA